MPKYLSFALATLLSVNAFAQTERQNAEFESENTVAKLACYYQQDYVTAEKIWQKWAEQGNPRAKSNLGYLYLRGCTSPYNPKGRPELNHIKAIPLLEEPHKQASSKLNICWETICRETGTPKKNACAA